MEVNVTVKNGLESRPKRLKRQVSIQDDVFFNRDEELNELERKVEHTDWTNHRNPAFKKFRSLNQKIFTSCQPGTYESRKQLNFHLEGHYGWFIVGFVFLLKLIITGPILNFNLLFFHLKTQVFPNHQYTEIIGCLNRISGHLVSPILTIIVLRYKVLRLFTILGCMLCALTLLFSAFSFQFHQFIITFTFLNGIFSELIQVCCTMIIIQYFRKKLWLVELIISLSDVVSYSVFSVLLHFLFSAYSWRKSLQLLSILTSSSLILAVFLRPASIYHPQRRAILHLKQERQQRFKQRLPEQNNDQMKKGYKLSDHFRQQSLEIATKAETKTRNGSVSSGISNGLNSGLSNANTSSSGRSNEANNTSCSSGLNADKSNTSSKNSTTTQTNLINTNSGQSSKQANMTSKFKANSDQDKRTLFSIFSGRQSSRQSNRGSRIKLKNSKFTAFCLDRRHCLTSLFKLIQSTSLAEYLDLLKSRDLKFIIIFSFLNSFIHFSFAFLYTDQQCPSIVHLQSNFSEEKYVDDFAMKRYAEKDTANSKKLANYRPKNIDSISSEIVYSTVSPFDQTLYNEQYAISAPVSNEKSAEMIRIISSLSWVNFSKVNIDERVESASNLMWLNVWFGGGYCVGLLCTSALLSRLYLTSQNSTKLAILFSSLSVIMIGMLTTCLLKRSALNLSDEWKWQSLSTANDTLTGYRQISLTLIRLWTVRLLVNLNDNVYTLQILLFIFYGYSQAQLNYSTRLLLIERFANKKLCKVISLHRFVIGLGQFTLLTIRLIVNFVRTDQSDQLVSTGWCSSSDDCNTFTSNSIIFSISLSAIIFLHFISNRSINRFNSSNNAKTKNQTKVVNQKSLRSSNVDSVSDKFKVSGELFKVSRILELLKINRLATASSVENISNLTERQNRFNYRKQLSESNLNDIKANPIKSPISRYNSDLLRIRSLEDTIFDFKDFIDLTSNYMIDCIRCDKSYIVYLDLEQFQLVELCSIDELEIEKVSDDSNNDKVDQIGKSNKIDKIERTDRIDKSKKDDKDEKQIENC